MSYIRCLSNPESLYIWGDCDGRVWISYGWLDPRRVPMDHFEELLRRWWYHDWDNDGEDGDNCTVGELRLEKQVHPVARTASDIGKWRLSDGDWSVVLWEVTLRCVAWGVMRDEEANDPWVTRMLGRLDRLESIVDKLPKTADGVPVVPGVDWVWRYVCVEAGTWNWTEVIASDRKRVLELCFSTREAAEAAREE